MAPEDTMVVAGPMGVVVLAGESLQPPPKVCATSLMTGPCAWSRSSAPSLSLDMPAIVIVRRRLLGFLLDKVPAQARPVQGLAVRPAASVPLPLEALALVPALAPVPAAPARLEHRSLPCSPAPPPPSLRLGQS